MCLLCDARVAAFTARVAAFATDGDASPRIALARRGFVGLLAAAGTSVALGQVDVGPPSSLRKLVPAETLENAATPQYAQLLSQARSQGALAPDTHPQLKRLRAIGQRIIPFAAAWNSRAAHWKWQINLIGSKQINAFCMPGGKIAFFTGILEQLQLSDDETAMVMGHEMAHALREHARERIAKTQATGMGLSIGAQLLGLGRVGDTVANLGTQLLSLKYSRDDESEADLVGLELAARAGYEPRAAVTLWEKMGKASARTNGASFLSTHPSGPDRIAKLQANVPRVEGLYRQARARG